MTQLIEIKTVPIKIEMKVSAAKLEYTRASADSEHIRNKGGSAVKSRPLRLDRDTFEMRHPIVPNSTRSIGQRAQKGRQAACGAPAADTRRGELLLKAMVGEGVPAPYSRTTLSPDRDAQPELTFLPSQFKFTPGDIEFSVKQQPDVIIKYIGGPLYVPPSADPNYKPVDVRA